MIESLEPRLFSFNPGRPGPAMAWSVQTLLYGKIWRATPIAHRYASRRGAS